MTKWKFNLCAQCKPTLCSAWCQPCNCRAFIWSYSPDCLYVNFLCLCLRFLCSLCCDSLICDASYGSWLHKVSWIIQPVVCMLLSMSRSCIWQQRSLLGFVFWIGNAALRHWHSKSPGAVAHRAHCVLPDKQPHKSNHCRSNSKTDKRKCINALVWPNNGTV